MTPRTGRQQIYYGKSRVGPISGHTLAPEERTPTPLTEETVKAWMDEHGGDALSAERAIRRENVLYSNRLTALKAAMAEFHAATGKKPVQAMHTVWLPNRQVPHDEFIARLNALIEEYNHE
jgi:hypothetical protein